MQPIQKNLIINENTLPVIAQLAESMPGGFFICHADGDLQLIYCNSRMVEILGCSGDDEFNAFVHNSLRDIVHPDDLAAVEASVRGQADQMEYRFVRKNGSTGILRNHAHFSKSETYGDICYAFAEDITKNAESEDLQAVIAALSDQYEMLLHMDFVTGNVKFYVTSDWVDKNLLDAFAKASYDEKIAYMAKKYVYEEDRKYFIEALKTETVIEQVCADQPLVLRYRMQQNDRLQWYELKAAHHKEHVGKKCAMVGIRNVQQEMEQQEKLNTVIYKNNQRLLAFHEIIHSGMWSIALSDEYEILQANWSDEYRRLLGYTDERDFPNEFSAWYEHVHPDEREMALADFRRGIRQNDTFESDFRVLNKNGLYRWYRAAGRVEKNADGGFTCFGIFTDTTAEHENKRYQEAQRQDMDIIEILASEYSSMYYIDLRTDGLKPYTMNAETESEFGQIFNSGISYSEAFALYVDRLVLPEDREMMLREGSVSNIRQMLENQKTFITHYRSSDNRFNEMKFVKVGSEAGEPLAVALGFADKDEEVRAEKEMEIEQQRYNAVVKVLSGEYSSIYYADIERNVLMPYGNSRRIQGKFGKNAFANMSYTQAVEAYISHACSAKDREELRKNLSREYMKAQLATKQYYTFIYQNDKDQYCEMKCVRANEAGEITAVVVGFAVKDEEIRAQIQVEQERERNYDIIEILASEYSSVYYIDLTTDGLDTYTMNEDTESAFGKIFRSGIAYSSAYKMYVQQLILPADREMMMVAGSRGNIMKELRNKKTFITTYRNVDGHYCEMKFVKVGNNEGLPTAVALGFADKDEELRSREEEQKKLQRNIDIIEILASEYTSVYYIDMMTEELDPYTMNEKTETQFGSIFRSGILYTDAFRMYVNTLVYADDREMMLKAGSIYNILSELTNKKSFITTYRNAEGHYSEMKFVKVGDDENPRAVALGFADKDAEIRAEMKRKEISERDAAVISGLSDDFGCVVYVSYEDFSEVHYRYDPLFEKSIPGWDKIENFKERLDALCETIMHPEDRKTFLEVTRPEIVKKMVEANHVYLINFRTLIDGKTTYYQLKFVKDEQHGDTNVIAGFHNVDAETRREMEALEKAESANKAKTAFLFNMSHDIRTPMNAIIGFTNMAMKDIDNPKKATESLEKVCLSSNMLLSLINDILDMSRIESGKVKLNESKCNAEQSFKTIAPVMSDLAKKKHIDISFSADGITDGYVLADIPRTERVLVNLISNAIKYTHEGGRVKVSLTQGALQPNGRRVFRYEIADNGVGMSEEFQKHMFEEFSREETATNSGVQGTGLGLALANKLVELMGGRITCVSKQGEGSVFTVELPLALQTEEQKRETEKTQTVRDVEYDLADRRVLLAEDNELNREIATDILEDKGMVVETAVNGREALDRVLEHGETYYDVILMDIQMPVMDGYQATAAIRNALPNLKVPIIALSANAFEEDRQKSRDAGMDDHIAKPINVNELMQTLQKRMMDESK